MAGSIFGSISRRLIGKYYLTRTGDLLAAKLAYELGTERREFAEAGAPTSDHELKASHMKLLLLPRQHLIAGQDFLVSSMVAQCGLSLLLKPQEKIFAAIDTSRTRRVNQSARGL